MSDSRHPDPPSPFVIEWIGRLSPERRPSARALDIAAGRGRHSEALARAGYVVFAVDRDHAALAQASARVALAQDGSEGGQLRAWVGDLTAYPLPRAFFDVVVVARYLQRDLFPALAQALVPGGVLIYETFTEAQLALGTGPRSPDHLVASGELRARCAESAGLDVLFYEEVTSPDAVARVVARRPRNSSNASGGSDALPSRAAPGDSSA